MNPEGASHLYSLSILQVLLCGLVLLLAYGLRGSTGFGSGAVVLLALIVPLKIVVPAWTLLSVLSGLTILGSERRHVSAQVIVRFTPWCLLGVVAGLYLFETLDARILTRSLGVLVVGYAGHVLWRARLSTPEPPISPRVIGPFAGTIAGLVGTLFGTLSTMFLGIYLDTCGLGKEAFRATMTAMLLLLSVMRGIGYFSAGEMPREVWLAFIASLPFVLVGTYLGSFAHQRLPERGFKQLIAATLVVSGGILILR